ncbi:hypothetical protein [Paenibacillus elgii]|uniref:hypothetical protein n=1 Tax=Paenibacillus elgii TaxID=189691 RepID=UPI001CB8DC68|nr:hypothetical protein [Paenibacillus elgii]
MLRVCGYATDPDYTRKLNNLVASYTLQKYDKEATEPMLNVRVADTIIDTWMSPAWKELNSKRLEAEQAGDVTTAAAYEQQADYTHWLANELRKASGQPVT